jgi:hypothetical protein
MNYFIIIEDFRRLRRLHFFTGFVKIQESPGKTGGLSKRSYVRIVDNQILLFQGIVYTKR